MSKNEPRQLAVIGSKGRVLIGNKDDGFFAMSPFAARDVARRLLVAADEAEGERPSHLYQVQAYEPA